jgi:hypothetical protein
MGHLSSGGKGAPSPMRKGMDDDVKEDVQKIVGRGWESWSVKKREGG